MLGVPKVLQIRTQTGVVHGWAFFVREIEVLMLQGHVRSKNFTVAV